MASNLLLPLLPCSLSYNKPRFSQPIKERKCSNANRMQVKGTLEKDGPLVNERRSGNYEPNVWDHRFVESTTSPYSEQHMKFHLEELKQEVSHVIKAPQDTQAKLRLIDDVDRLGVAYHFENEIEGALDQILNEEAGDDLFNTALRFRILRQYGHKVSPEVFEKFKDKEGNFKESLYRDARGLLSLYEASYLSVDGEDILDKARDFTMTQLKESKNSLDTSIGHEIEHALDLPLRWRLSRLESRNFIQAYSKKDGMNPVLLEFAKLDFNITQSVHQSELREMSRWWRGLGFKEKLSFSRDRCVELYIWALGVSYEAKFTHMRTVAAKVTAIGTSIDDVYDIYGSLDELELFTNAVERWDLDDLENFPDYMKIAYMAVFNLVNNLAYESLTDFGVHILPIIKKEWENSCKAYLVEARWFSKGYTPTLEEYLNNGWISIGGSTIMMHGYAFLGHALGMKPTDFLEQVSRLVYWSSMVVRLTDDLATFKDEQERGDVSSSIQCYMKDTGKSEEDAIEYINNLVIESWKGLNKECLSSTLPRQFIHGACDFARVSHFFYNHGDGLGCSPRETRDNILSMFFEPV